MLLQLPWTEEVEVETHGNYILQADRPTIIYILLTKLSACANVIVFCSSMLYLSLSKITLYCHRTLYHDMVSDRKTA